jgi:hypothetical protein
LVTGILVHGILQLGSVPLTFHASRTLAVGLFPVPGQDAARTARLFESILEGAQALPGVEGRSGDYAASGLTPYRSARKALLGDFTHFTV